MPNCHAVSFFEFYLKQYCWVAQPGLKMAEARTGKTKPLKAGGALMLGGEQACPSCELYSLQDVVALPRCSISVACVLLAVLHDRA